MKLAKDVNSSVCWLNEKENVDNNQKDEKNDYVNDF